MGGASGWGMSTSYVPSVRSAFAARVIASVRSLIDSGRVSSAELGRWLSADEIACLRAGSELAEWLPVSFGTHLLEIIRAVEGSGAHARLRERGESTARLLLDAHLRDQLETLRLIKRGASVTREERFAAFGRDLSRSVAFVRSNLNFSVWTIKKDPAVDFRHLIEIEEADALPDLFVLQLDGFFNTIAAECEQPELWTSQRVRADRVVFRMTRSL